MKIISAKLDNAKDIARIEYNSGYHWSKYSLEEEIRLATKLLIDGEEKVF